MGMLVRLASAIAPAATALVLVTENVSWADGPQPLTACGQQLEGSYYLTGDLDCTGVPGHGVDLKTYRARLELRGFKISNASVYGVQCRFSCKVIGPGTISGSFGDALRIGGMGRVEDVTIIDNGYGIEAANNAGRSRVTLRRSHVENNNTGVYGDSRVRLIDSAVINNADFGVLVGCDHGKSSLKNSTVQNNGVNFSCR